MRLWKRAPFTLCLMAFVSLAAEFALQLIPDAGMLASKLLPPLLTCGMFVGAHAIESGGRARVTDVLVPFTASAAAIGAIVVSSLAIFAAEALAAYIVADANLLRVANPDMDLAAVLAMFAVGVLVSLPFTFLPMCALIDHMGFAQSFSASFRAFSANVPAFLLYGLLSYALLLVGIATLGVGLVIVLPLWATSSYVAWRDVMHAA
jgi:hypothetical protein